MLRTVQCCAPAESCAKGREPAAPVLFSASVGRREQRAKPTQGRQDQTPDLFNPTRAASHKHIQTQAQAQSEAHYIDGGYTA